MKIEFITIIILLLLTSCSAQKSKTDYNERTKKVLELAEKNIYNPALLKTEEWSKFESYIASDKLEKLDAEAYVEAFNKKSNALSFSHFYMDYTGKYATEEYKAIRAKRKKQNKKPFELKEIDKNTVVLTIRKFVSDAALMIPIVEELKEKKHANLIIDLRNNGGGSLDAAVVIGRYLTANPMDAGAYLTRQWYNKNTGLPTKEQIQKFPYMTKMTLEGFREIQKEDAFRMVLPGHNNPTFSGNLYVLTNRFSGSACEPFVDVLKNQMGATVVGEATAGAMLSAVWFDVEKDLSIFIPINDYVTAEGKRLDRVGVKPNIEVDPENALEETLKIIGSK